jgi:hypothetical protein
MFRIEVIYKPITYIDGWYRTLYHVLLVVLTTRMATRSNTDSHNRLDLIQSSVPLHYICNRYVSHILVQGHIKTNVYRFIYHFNTKHTLNK